MPGAGSLVAGRVSGYAQLALAIIGTVISVLLGLRFIWWFLANWSRLYNPDADPAAALGEIWRALKWPLIGFGLFLLGWLWALVTGVGIVLSSRKAEGSNVPPRL
jgi:putative Mn2+ efflux pump MntP